MSSKLKKLVLAEEDRRTTRLEGMRYALEMTDGVICRRRDIKVKFWSEPSNPYPAWCANGTINISVGVIPDLMSVRGMGTLIGLNYHEVAHTLYSPKGAHNGLRATSVKHSCFEDAYRVLEENRVETLMIGRYADVRKNFLFPVLTFLKKTDSVLDAEMFLLTHGRRYIPQQIRGYYRACFERQHGNKLTGQCADIIDLYRFTVLESPEDYLAAGDLVNRLAKILAENGIDPPKPEEGSSGGEMVRDAPSSSGQQKDAEKSKQQEREEAGEDAQSGAGSVSGDGGEGAPDRSDASPAEDGGPGSQDADREEHGADGDDSQDGGGGGQDQQGEAGGSSPSGSGSGRSDGAQGGSDRKGDPSPSDGVGSQEDRNPGISEPSQLFDEIEQEMSRLIKDDAVLREVGSLRRAMEDHVAQNSVLEEDPARVRKYPVDAAMVRRSEEVAQQLAQLWAQIDPGWSFGVSEGARLDMNRIFGAQTEEDMENVYIEWEPGRQESSGVEYVIVGDGSGSMSDYGSVVEGSGGKKRFQVASESVWSVRHAMDRVEAKGTVLTFQTGCKVLHHRDEEVDPGHYHLFSSDGGTWPALAVQEARRILAVSDRPHKILLVFTDGSWPDTDDRIRESLDAMDDVVKVCALIRGGSDRRWEFRYNDNFDVVEETNGDLMDIMARAVIHLMERIVL